MIEHGLQVIGEVYIPVYHPYRVCYRPNLRVIFSLEVDPLIKEDLVCSVEGPQIEGVVFDVEFLGEESRCDQLLDVFVEEGPLFLTRRS